MARLHGKGGTVTVSGITVSGVTSFSYDETADSVDATAMGDTSKQYLGGLRDGSGTVELRLVTEDFTSGVTGQDAFYDAMGLGTSVSLVLDIGGTPSAGQIEALSGSPIINSFAMSASFDDVVNITFGYQGSLAPVFA